MINAETICHQDLSCIISHLPHFAKIVDLSEHMENGMDKK